MTVWFVIRKKNNNNKIKNKMKEPSPAVNTISYKTKKQTYRSKLTQRNNETLPLKNYSELKATSMSQIIRV